MDEIWKDVKTWEGIYQVSNLGRIRCIRYKYFEGDESGDYTRVLLSDKDRKKRYPLHRLILESFEEKPEDKEVVNHKDGNKKNNTLVNLEWATRSENTQHAIDNGLRKTAKGEDSGVSKLTEDEVRSILKELKQGKSLTYLAKKYNTGFPNISLIKNNKAWKHIERE